MIRRPPRSTRVRSSAASDVYKRQWIDSARKEWIKENIDSEIEFSSKGDKNSWNIQGEDNKVSICKTFKGGSGKGGLDDSDYDVRLAKEAFGYLLDEDVGKVDIYSSYKNHKGDTQRLKEFRKRKEALLKNELEFYRKVVKAADDGVFDLDTDVIWKHLPQTNEELDNGGLA